MAEHSHEDYVFVGGFTPREIKRVTDHLERIEVDYQVEFDDSDIRDLPPEAVIYGQVGTSATVKLYVDPQKLLEFEAVIATLYPP